MYLKKLSLSFCAIVMTTSSLFALQTHVYPVKESSAADCQTYFLVLSDDDGRFIASGYSLQGTACSRDGLSSPAGLLYRDDPESPGLLTYLQKNEAAVHQLDEYIRENYLTRPGEPEVEANSNSSDFPIMPAVTIAPNPALDRLEIILARQATQSWRVELFSADGQLLRQLNSIEARKWKASLNVSELAAATYTLKVSVDGEILKVTEVQLF